MKIVYKQAKKLSYGSSRSTSSIAWIAIHYTGNKTDTAKNNANYFSPSGSNTRYAGAHYFVDSSDTGYQSIKDNITAWSVGDNGAGKYKGICTNFNSISIEMCSTNGIITDKTINNTAELVKKLMKTYNIKEDHVIRHYDVTCKQCPGWSGWYGKNAPKWEAFKKKIKITTPVVVKTESKAKTTATAVLKEVKTTVKSAVSSSFKVKVTTASLNVRVGAGVNNKIATQNKKQVAIHRGEIYTITATKKVGNSTWGKLKSGIGWINLSYTKKI